MIEYETKILNINKKEIITKLNELEAKKIGDFNFKRIIFKLKEKKSGRIRLRTDGKTTTLTYKNNFSSNINGAEEIETTVADFETTKEIFMKIKDTFSGIYYQENKREMYLFEDIEFCIDTWKNIPVYMEIESTSIEKVNKGLELLNLKGKEFGNKTVSDVYKHYGIELQSTKL